MEFNIVNRKEVPSTLYHIVPKIYFSNFVKQDKAYDCRGSHLWGHGENFIHTASSIEVLRDRVIGDRWSEFEEFYLLTIESDLIEHKMTFSLYGDIKYFHIWGEINNSAYNIREIKRDDGGRLIM